MALDAAELFVLRTIRTVSSEALLSASASGVLMSQLESATTEDGTAPPVEVTSAIEAILDTIVEDITEVAKEVATEVSVVADVVQVAAIVNLWFGLKEGRYL